MLIISLNSVLRELSDNFHLVSRPLGMLVRERLMTLIQNSGEKIVIIDFDEVGIVDYSGADEVIVRLISRLVNKELGDKYILLRGMELIHKDNIKAAFTINKKHAVLEVNENDTLSLIGNIKPMLVEVLERVYNDQVITARGLADLTSSEINLTSTKLLQLYQERLIMRKEDSLIEGGRQFNYIPVLNYKIVIRG